MSSTTSALAGVAALTIVAGCRSPETAKHAVQDLPPVAAEVQTVRSSDNATTTTVTGTVKARYNATLSAKAMGRVVSVNVREGDTVRDGQVLLTVDGRELEAALNMAGANHRASVVGIGSARTAADIESKTSEARITQAEFQVRQAEAALASSIARYDLAVAGTRKQEVTQSQIAVTQAESSLRLAKTELDRTSRLVDAGAVARRELDMAQNRYDLAKGQYEAALQMENLAKEGSRTQEIKAAEEAVNQARAALNGAKAGLVQAKAAALQTRIRAKDVDVARAQERQAAAAVQSAQVSLSYTRVFAPFEGRVVRRLVDPGTMATPGTPLLAVEGGGFLFEAVVPERVVRSLDVGTQAEVAIDALEGRSVSGKVAEIVPQGDPSTHTFVVKFALGPVAGLKSGMFARADVRTGSAQGLRIPTSATWKKDGLEYVFVVNDQGSARLRLVTLGQEANGGVEVLSGLTDGDRIIVGDRNGIVDGVQVEAKKR